MDVKGLIEQARAILAQVDTETCLQELEVFTANFFAWQSEYLTNLELGSLKESQIGELQELAALHQQVIERVESLQQETRNEFKRLKALGKGLVAYTDKLPKKMSTRGVKKW